MPKNFRIWIQPALDEAVLPKPITDESPKLLQVLACKINELAIASQPQDQALWDSVGMISSDLDWLVKESAP